MKCPVCEAWRKLKLHDVGTETVAVMVCPRCLTTDALPQPSMADVMAYRAEVSDKLRHMGIAA